eukprot:TRINITY_DN1235_c0_g1_i3.p2 TRINITY_DN1235_c0_g1~~TRINITY_DN1235_c0_g1_i3.p2  ORF type:complete len:126 (+),score=9.53 TRINITY_DN1235_c0_g1_i3:467-844(+)
MSTVNQYKSITDGLDAIRRRVEEAIRGSRGQDCVRYVRQLTQQFKKDRRVLNRTEQGMAYAVQVEVCHVIHLYPCTSALCISNHIDPAHVNPLTPSTVAPQSVYLVHPALFEGARTTTIRGTATV